MATAKKKSTKKSTKKLNIKIKMIGDLIDVTGSSKDSWNPAEISDDMKAISYIRKLADSWNTAQLNEALKYLGFKTVDTWNAAELEETKNKLVKYFLPTEATGNPITLNAYGNLPYEVSKAEVTFLPKQDLHGYDNPWVGGAGKNKLKNTATSTTVNGVTYTVNDDKTITASGTATGTAVLTISNMVSISPSYGTVTLSCLEDTTNLIYNTVFLYDDNGNVVGEIVKTGTEQNKLNKTFNLSDYPTATKIYVSIKRSSNTDVSGVIKPQLEIGSTATDYTPYENICPISGRTEVNLYVDEEQSLSPANTYTETLGATYYGGKVDFVSGEGSEEWDYIASYDGETLPGEWISDRDAYAPGTTPTTGAEVAYKLSEAVDLTLTPQEIELLKGQNVIWTDGDSITIKYKALLN